MKRLLISALVILAAGSLHAADRVQVQASFFRAAPGKRLPNDLQRLEKTKGVLRKVDRATTRSGGVAQVQATLPFIVGPQVGGHPHRIPTGCVVRVTPLITGDRITYKAQITLRDFSGWNRKQRPDVKFNATAVAFSSFDIYMSGATKFEDVAWLWIPDRHGEWNYAVCLQFNRENA